MLCSQSVSRVLVKGLLGSLALIAVAGFAQQPEGPRILRPADDSVLEPGPVSLIARTDGKGKLVLDGETLAARQPAAGVLTADLAPSPGRHELVLTVGGRTHRIQFQIGTDPAPPADWKLYRAHPPSASCDTCHGVTGAVWTIKGEAPASGCLSCHDAVSFQTFHTHASEELQDCGLCHDPHGSTAKRRLIMPKAVACRQCHE